MAGNNFAGNSTYTFTTVAAPDTTPPTITTLSPANSAVSVAVANDIILTFSEPVQRGTGNILLKDSAGNLVATYDVATSSNITLSGSTLTINPTNDLNYSTGYKVEVAAGSIKDLAGNNFAGNLNYNFTTLKAPSLTLSGTLASDTLIGGAGDDTLFGDTGDDALTGGFGNDFIDGGKGRDVANYAETISNYTIKRAGDFYIVDSKSKVDGNDTLTNIENLKFRDMTVNLTIHETAKSIPQADVQKIMELYVAFFNRVPDADGLEYWISEMKGGKTINQIADTFYSAGVQFSEVTGYTATMSNADFINVIYKNVLGRVDGADSGGLTYWSEKLSTGSATRGTLVSTIIYAAHGFKGDTTWGWVADLLDNKIEVAKSFAQDLALNYLTPNDSITKGMAIAAAITPIDKTAALTLIGVSPNDIQLG